MLVEILMPMKSIETKNAVIKMSRLMDALNKIEDKPFKFSCKEHEQQVAMCMKCPNPVYFLPLNQFEGLFSNDQSVSALLQTTKSIDHLLNEDIAVIDHILSGFKLDVRYNISKHTFERIQDVLTYEIDEDTKDF